MRYTHPFLSLLFFSILVLAVQPVFAKDAEEEEIATLKAGAPAPELNLLGVDGKTYRLDDFADAKVLVVVFTCNHCPTAQAYEKRIVQLHADYLDKEVAMVAISPSDPLAVRLDEHGYTDPNSPLKKPRSGTSSGQGEPETCEWFSGCFWVGAISRCDSKR